MDSSAAVNATTSMALPIVDTGATFFTTLGYLCLLLGVIFLAYYLLRRLGIQGVGMQGGEGAPRLMSRLMLGQHHGVVVVRYRGKDMLLGVTEERISLLDKGDADESLKVSTGPKSFASFLKRSTDDEG